MNVRPVTSISLGPSARCMKIGVPPTERKARTGLCTPPGATLQRARKQLRVIDHTGTPSARARRAP